MGQQLVDLLVLALKADERTLTTGNSTVREAHLTRIEAFVRRNMGDPELDPEAIARGCGISTRYLHELFRDTNQTLGSWIRDQRLEACREALRDTVQPPDGGRNRLSLGLQRPGAVLAGLQGAFRCSAQGIP